MKPDRKGPVDISGLKGSSELSFNQTGLFQFGINNYKASRMKSLPVKGQDSQVLH